MFILDIFVIPILILIALLLFRLLKEFTRNCKQGIDFADFWTVEVKKYALFLAAAIFLLLFIHPSQYLSFMIFAVIPILFGNLLLTLIFKGIYKMNPARSLWFFYHVGQILTIFFCLFATDQHFTWSDWFHWYDPILIAFLISFIISLPILFCSAMIALLAFIFRGSKNAGKRRQKFTQFKATPSRNMLKHYQAQGLSKQEIEAFRSQMANTRDQIISIENNFQVTAKMRAIEIHHNLVKVAKNYFKDIVEEPQRRLAASDFLINYLPQLQDLLEKYNEVNSHVAKNKQTYLILEKSAQTIDKISQEIVDDYLKFHEETYQELEDGLKLADRILHQYKDDGKHRFGAAAQSTHFSSSLEEDPFDEFE